MPTSFFNFGNEETFHFFVWLTASGQVDPQELIDRAFKAAEGDAWLAMGLDVCEVVRDKLAAILAGLLEEFAWASPLGANHLDAPEIGDVWNGADALWSPILGLALRRIHSQSVAQALLIHAGKWLPSKVCPEAI